MTNPTFARRRVLSYGGCMLIAAILVLARPGGTLAAQADPQPFDPFASGTSIAFNRLSTSDGLSFAVVRSMLRDRRGFMWFGAVVGLNRYDGYTFKTFGPDPGVADSLQSTTISALAQDGAGTIWIGSTDGGLDAYDPRTERFTSYRPDPADPASLSGANVRSLAVDASGALWVGSWGGGLHRRDPRTGTFTRYRHDPADAASLSSDLVQTVLASRDGTVWVGTNGGGLSRLDPRSGTFTHYRHDAADPASLSDDRVRVVYEDQAGRLWVGTNGGGLNRLDPRSGTFTRYRHDAADPASLSDDRVTALHQDQTGRLWVGTFGGGLNLLDQQLAQFAHWVNDRDDPRSLPNNTITALVEDRSGLLWIATEGDGVASFDLYGRPFRLYTSQPDSPEGLSHDVVRGLARDDAGTFWVGTFGGGLNRLDPRTGTFTHYRHDAADPASLSDDLIWTVYVDRANVVWVGADNGVLNRLDPATGRFTHFQPPDADGARYAIHAIYEDRAGALWIGSNGGGLSRFDRAGERFTSYRYDPADPRSLSHNYVSSIYEDRAGTLWVGTFGGGLSRFDRAGERFTTYRHDPADPRSLSNSLVTDVYMDHAGTLWVGTAAGLNRFDPATASFSHITERDGLQSNLVQGIMEADGRLWISSQRGLSMLDPQTLAIRNFGVADGLLARGFTPGVVAPGAGGLAAAGGFGGVVVFDPSGVDVARPSPPIAITGMRINNQPVTIGGASPLTQAIDETDALVLPAGSRNVSLELAALDYRAPQLLRYRYRLEGVDSQWNEGGAERRIVTYHDLGPGTYVLHASATPQVGHWSEPGRSLTITILPFWWQTLWFRGAVVVLVGLVVVGGIWLRFRTIQAGNRKLEQEVASRTQALVEQADELEQTAVVARQSRDQLESLLAIANEIVSMHDIDAMLERILDHLARIVDYDSAYIHTLEGNILTVQAFHTRLSFPDMRGRTFETRSMPALERLVTTQEPLLVEDVQLDTELQSSVETVIGHPVTHRAWIAVPLIVDGRTIGILSLLHQVAGSYRPADLERVQSFANQVTIAIHNIWLYERDQQAAVLEERNRLARELHDAVTQTVFSASLIAEALPTSWQGAPPRAMQGVEQLHQLTRTALAEMRSLLIELRPAALTERPLGELLQALCSATSGRSGIPIRLEVRGACQELRPEVQIALYRLTQEALNNVIKHADASEAWVILGCQPAEVRLAIRDDGCGFDPTHTSPDTFGLHSMRERAAQIGATLHITSQRHKGTTVAIEWRARSQDSRPLVNSPDAAEPAARTSWR